MADETLAQRVRAKHPGAYDDLSDADLEAAVLKKFPGVYDDIPRTKTQAPAERPAPAAAGPRMGPAPAAPWSIGKLGEVAKQVADPGIGIAKGAANTLIGAGELVYDYMPGVSAVSDAVAGGNAKPAFAAAREMVQPSNTAQKIGYTAEQLAEFFIPASKAGKALNLAKDVGLSYLQTGDPTTAAATGVVGAALPMAGKVAKGASGILAKGAQKNVAQAIGATKEWAKSDAAKLAPEMLARGVSGTREAMLEQATQKIKEIGPRIGRIYQKAGEEGKSISGLVIRGELQFARDALMVPGATGKLIPIEGAGRVVKTLDKLEQFVEKLGDDVPVQHAAKIATAWGKIASKAGLFGPKATASATDNADAWAIREGTSAIRQLLNDVDPELATLNREYSFWKGLRNVLKETEQRTQAQSGGILNAIGSSPAGAAGAMATMMGGGGPGEVLTGAFATQAAAHQFLRLIRSPWWKTSVSAPAKDHLARALATGNQGHVSAAIARIAAGLPSQARQALAQ
jgi:hypothetical protein